MATSILGCWRWCGEFSAALRWWAWRAANYDDCCRTAICYCVAYRHIGTIESPSYEAYKRESLQVLTGTPQHNDSDKNWKERLENIVTFPDETAVRRYINKVVKPALIEVSEEFKAQQFEIKIEDTDEALVLTVIWAMTLSSFMLCILYRQNSLNLVQVTHQHWTKTKRPRTIAPKCTLVKWSEL